MADYITYTAAASLTCLLVKPEAVSTRISVLIEISAHGICRQTGYARRQMLDAMLSHSKFVSEAESRMYPPSLRLGCEKMMKTMLSPLPLPARAHAHVHTRESACVCHKRKRRPKEIAS